jgi:hypothetical protein
MEKLEPRFNLSKIRIIFADMKVTDTLLSKLGIQDSCGLRCDMWHMMNEVWPKQNAFGSVHYDSVRHFLKGMLESRDEEYWENCYKSARRELMFRRQTEMAQYLDIIHVKPSYYAGYYLHTVLGGSLGKNGDTTTRIARSLKILSSGIRSALLTSYRDIDSAPKPTNWIKAESMNCGWVSFP